jgi:molybdopterin-guanine dinucleotide biosynthesis protein A
MSAAQLGAVVLCGGESRRMGLDKASLPFGAETLLDRVLRQVRTVTADIVLAAAPGQAVPAGFQVSRDRFKGEGPLPALLDAVERLATRRVFVVACDTPLLQPALITLLEGLCAGSEGAVPIVDGNRIPTCAVYQTSALLDAREPFGNPAHRSVRDFITRLRIRDVPPAQIRPVDPRLLSFTPCNTPEEYRHALTLAGLEVNDLPPPAV